jgi:hypothetical protein
VCLESEMSGTGPKFARSKDREKRGRPPKQLTSAYGQLDEFRSLSHSDTHGQVSALPTTARIAGYGRPLLLSNDDVRLDDDVGHGRGGVSESAPYGVHVGSANFDLPSVLC